jgi:tryptophan-rich sensory protein
MTRTSIDRAGLLSLAFWLLVSFAAAGIGGLASAQSAEFYLQLERPAWAPPAGVFGPVWSILYALMGISAWLVWRERRLAGGWAPYAWFFAQLAANALWTWIFFVWRQGAWAFIEILVLIVLIVGTIVSFRAIKATAAWLLLPYLAWVCFAAALTFALWRSNPGVL